jgi:putative endonuclease
MNSKKSSWFVYMVRCNDGSIYTGISNAVADRIKAHNSGEGAKYTASRSPVNLIFQEKHPDKSSAFKREIQIKRWSKGRKEKLSKFRD